MNARAPSIDVTQGYAAHASGLSRQEYEAALSSPAYLGARRAHARKLADALKKEDYAEYLAISSFDYSMDEISEKLRAYTPGPPAKGFSEFLDRKAGRVTTTMASAAPIPAASAPSLWDEVVADINASLQQRNV